MFCHLFVLVSSIVLCFVLLNGDWMERKLHSVLNCSVL